MSTFKFSKTVALRYLWARQSEAFITIITVISILGVAIGVMVLNIVMAVMTGFEYELQNKIVGASSHIIVRQIGKNVNNWQEVSDEIKTIKNVDTVSPFTYNQVLLQSNNKSSGIIVKGLEEGSAGAKQIEGYIKQGSASALFAEATVDSDNNMPGIVIGLELSRMYGLYNGSIVSLLSSGMSSSPFGLIPRYRRFKVVGIYNSGLVEYESGIAYVSLAEAQQFFRLGDSIAGLDVNVKNVNESSLTVQEILDKVTPIQQGFYAQDWKELNRPLWEAMSLEKRVYFLVLLLIIVMASFSIITSLVMIVLEKRKDIAVLKTLGASTKSIATVFVIMGGAIGAIGTTLGLIGGYLGCIALRIYGFPMPKIFPVSTLPIKMEPMNFIIVGIVSFLICLIATIYPAKRASSLEPSTVLRG